MVRDLKAWCRARIAKQYRDENKETEANQSESATGKIEEIDDIGYDEDPVSLFSPKNNMFDGTVLSRKHKKGDRRFNVYGHGETTFMFDEDGLEMRMILI